MTDEKKPPLDEAERALWNVVQPTLPEAPKPFPYATMPGDHRWSGWPGAWCLDCGTEDQREICCAEHGVTFECAAGHFVDLREGAPPGVCEQGHPLQTCTEHVNPPCPEPGSNRHNPYTR